MNNLLDWMKDIYTTAKEGRLDWKDYHPNGMDVNPKEGIYATYTFNNGDGTYTFIKLSITYKYRTDEFGCSHPGEGVKYYVLQKIEFKNLNCEPNMYAQRMMNVHSTDGYLNVFEDETTAIKAAEHLLIQLIYPYTYIMSEEEGAEWNKFLDSFKQ